MLETHLLVRNLFLSSSCYVLILKRNNRRLVNNQISIVSTTSKRNRCLLALQTFKLKFNNFSKCSQKFSKYFPVLSVFDVMRGLPWIDWVPFDSFNIHETEPHGEQWCDTYYCHTGNRATDLFFLYFSMKLRALDVFLHFFNCFPW